MGMDVILFFVLAIVIIIVLVLFFSMFPVGLWIEARVSGVQVSLISMFAMRLRRVNPTKIVRAMIQARKAGVQVDRDKLVLHQYTKHF